MPSSGIRHVIGDIQKNRRPDTQVVVILVSDGNSGQLDTIDKAMAAAKELFATGAVAYAATFSSDAYIPELELYTGSCSDNLGQSVFLF